MPSEPPESSPWAEPPREVSATGASVSRAFCGEASGLSYTWIAAGWSGPPVQATWNGQAVEIQDDSLTVTGNGTLEIDGTAFLEVSGGATGRELVIRIR